MNLPKFSTIFSEQSSKKTNAWKLTAKRIAELRKVPISQGVIPDADVLRRYRELGGNKISFGSDAHRADNLCYNYDAVAKAMKDIGFKGFTRYYNRKPELVKF